MPFSSSTCLRSLRPAFNSPRCRATVNRSLHCFTSASCSVCCFDWASSCTDEVFQPAALLRAYAGTDPKLCLSRINYPYLYLPYVQALAGIERVPLRYHPGRKSFATLPGHDDDRPPNRVELQPSPGHQRNRAAGLVSAHDPQKDGIKGWQMRDKRGAIRSTLTSKKHIERS